MLRILNDSTNPHFNLALEEYLVVSADLDDDVVVLWRNEPTVVIGRNQNAELQINRPFLRERSIHLARRMSGGGAVYHDLGNLNFTVIKRDARHLQNDFSFFTEPVVACLASFGVEAQFSGRNDITVDGKKFSGNAQYRYGDTLLHHGTILFESELSVLAGALVPKKRLEVPGVPSVASRVTNLREYVPAPIGVFTDALATALTAFGGSTVESRELTEQERRAVRELADQKYGTDRWRWGESPAYNWVREARLSAGNVIACARTVDGTVVDFALFGDYFEVEPVLELEQMFVGHELGALPSLAASLPVERYLHGATGAELAALLSMPA